MGKKGRKANCLFGSRYLLSQVEALQKEIDGAMVGDDIEHVHQMRVASRRMRNGLSLFKDCLSKSQAKTWGKEIQTITKALGNARDLDIQIDLLNRFYTGTLEERYKPGINRLLLRLNQQREKAQKKVTRTLEDLQAQGTLEQMRRQLCEMTAGSESLYLFAPSLYKHAFEAISSTLEEFLSYEAHIHDPEKVAELHAMRIAGKHLRYTLEVFAPIYGHTLDPHVRAMKELQDLLGEIHDNDVWIAWLPKFIEKEQARIEDYFGNTGPLKRLLPGLKYLQEDRQQARVEGYQSFLTTWDTLKYENAWAVLKQIIKAPVDIEAALSQLPLKTGEGPQKDAPSAGEETPQPNTSNDPADDNELIP